MTWNIVSDSSCDLPMNSFTKMCIRDRSCDYPNFGAAAARAVAEGKCQRGIVICTTGIGISIAANKIKGIRCAHCADCLEAEMTRRHNDANMLAIGAGFTGKNMAERMVEVFLSTEFELSLIHI